jgi:hypothetical protein
MKRIILIIIILLCAFVSLGQIPYKIQNWRINQVWSGDTAQQYIFNKDTADSDSIVFSGNIPAYLMWDSTYIPEFVPGLGDTNILFVDGTTGRLRITTAAAIGGSASSKWTTTGTTLHPIDTGKFVAIGTNDALGYNFYSPGTFNLEDTMISMRSGYWWNPGTSNFSGMWRRTNNDQTWMLGMLDLVPLGAQRKWVMGFVNDTSVFGYTHRRIMMSVDTVLGIDIYASAIPGYPINGIHLSTPILTSTYVMESDIEIDTNSITLARKFFNSTSQLHSQSLRLSDSGFAYINKPYVGAGANLFHFDTLGYLTLNSAYTFPNADGNASDVLTTDGSGNVTWQPAAGGASYWDSTNTVIHTNDSLADVAIGTSKTNKDEKLRVYNGSVLFNGTVGYTPDTLAGAKFMWIPSMAALRAGDMTYDVWLLKANIGQGSTAFGSAKASGLSSFAAGTFQTSATGNYAVALGYVAAATGDQSFATSSATASGYYSVATGTSTASGYWTHSANYNATAQSYASSAFGRYNVITGNGTSWVSTDPLFQIGNGTGTGANSNDAFSVLKNGTTYIGDASSTTDPIMTVNTTDSTVDVRGWLMVDRKDHGFYAFEDSSVVIDCSTDTWVQVTNGTKTLFSAVQTDAGFTIQNDTITFNPHDTISGTSPHIIFHWGVDGHGANGEDFEVRIYNVTSATGIVRKAEGSTSGANNRIEIGTTSYDNAANVGDKYVLQIKNVGSNNDFTIENGSIYMEVSHY